MKVALKSVTDNVDIDEFINQIQRYQIIWNPKHEKYRDTHYRRAAWDHVIRHFVPQFSTKSIKWKNNVVLSFQNKWRKLYRYFVKESKKIRQQGLEAYLANRHKHFIYFNRLSFLEPVVKYDEESDGVSPEEIIIDEDDSDTDNKSLMGERSAKEYIKNTDHGKRPRPILECCPSTSHSNLQLNQIDFTENDPNNNTRKRTRSENENQEDSDKMFLLSLLPDLRTIPTHSKLHVKSQMLVTLLSGKKQLPLSHSSPLIGRSRKKSSFVMNVSNAGRDVHCEDSLSETNVPGNDNDEDDVLLVTSCAPKKKSHNISDDSA